MKIFQKFFFLLTAVATFIFVANVAQADCGCPGGKKKRGAEPIPPQKPNGMTLTR